MILISMLVKNICDDDDDGGGGGVHADYGTDDDP